MQKPRISLLPAILIMVSPARHAQAAAGDIEFFESRIRPILAKNCEMCHSRQAKAAQGGLVVDSRDAIRRGGQSGPAVVPGNPEESLLIQAIRYDGKLRMPPMGKLSDTAIDDLTRWVRMGAPDPRKSASLTVAQDDVWQIDIKKGREFWAFQAPVKAKPPATKNKSWPQSDIDRFVLTRLEAKGLAPVADAERATLLRRVTFDLSGLPPTTAELDGFLADKSEDAYRKVVDRLLASERFGERWGRHWLDVARYAESIGRTRNYAFPYAWRYRDYVIAAFNRDKPYDRFLAEQIAGDLLPASSADEKNRQTIATAFLALGAHDLNEQDRKQAFMDVVDEQINAVTRSMLALTVGCARCHDHKFDPIPTRDYYALAGIFASTEIANGLRQRPPLNQAHFTTTRLLTLEGMPGEPEADAAKRAQLWAKVAEIEARRRQPQRDRQDLNRLAGEIAGLGLPPNLAMGVRETGQARDCEVYLRGDPHAPGGRVPRGFVQVLFDESTPLPVVGERESGRLQLAHWLTRHDNPLTARVMANRVWLHMFGRGIVDTPDNFGNSGARPSHPDLLDYLAVRFMEQGWSVKKLLRDIALSRTYRLSSGHSAKNHGIDPGNELLWRANRRRLEAEALRDSLLAVSGRLTLEAPKASSIAGFDTSVDIGRRRNGPRPEGLYRTSTVRSVYLPVVRNFVPGFFEAFDFPEPSETRGRRDVTTVAPQALYLMNDPFVLEQARVAAETALEKEGADSARVAAAYRQTLSRQPSVAETGRALAYIASDPAGGWTRFYQALFASAEFRYRF